MVKSTKVKVLFIHHGTGIGGAPISLLNLVKALDIRKYEIKVAFIKDSPVVTLFKEAGISVEIINASNKFFTHNETGAISWRYFHRYIYILYHWLNTAYRVAPKYLKKQDVDLIHLNSHVLSSWAFAAKRLDLKVVVHNRETVAKGYFGIRRSILRIIYSYAADKIINISHDNADRIGLKSKSEVIYNFVDIPETYRFPFSQADKRYRILFLGGMASIKGFSVVVDCLRYLNKNITIQFAGNIGRYDHSAKGLKNIFKNLVKMTLFRTVYAPLIKLNGASNAEIIGMLKEPLKAIDRSDILITPFLIEHFSRPAIEAFAYGKPVIGSNVEGMDEIVDHSVNGLLVEKGNPKALADAINYLCSNPKLAQKMGEEGRKKADRLFSPAPNVAKVEKLYQHLLAEEIMVPSAQ